MQPRTAAFMFQEGLRVLWVQNGRGRATVAIVSLLLSPFTRSLLWSFASQPAPGSAVVELGNDGVLAIAPEQPGDDVQAEPASARHMTDEYSAVLPDPLAALGSTDAKSEEEEVCDLTVPLVRSEAVHELILTTRDALYENFGIHGPTGSAVYPAFQNEALISSLADIYDEPNLQRLENSVRRSGFSVPAVEYSALFLLGKHEGKLLECGGCYAGSRYASVKVESSGRDRRGRIFYRLVETGFPGWRQTGRSFLVYQDSLLVEGTDELLAGVSGILVCVESGSMPFFVARPIGTFSQSPLFRPGPFRQPVEVVVAEAVRGPAPSSATLKATLLSDSELEAVAHVLPDVMTLTVFARLPGPALAESAFALSALRRNPRCTLERATGYSPLRIDCDAWKELKERLEERHRAKVLGQKVRAARWVAAKVIAAVALVSLVMAYFGYRKDSRVGRAARVISGAESPDMMEYLREEHGIRNSAVLTMASSMDVDNLSSAAEHLTRRSSPLERLLRTRQAAKALVLRGAGGYGMAGAAGATAGVVPFFLLHKGYEAAKGVWKRARLQNHVSSVLRGAASTTKAFEQRGRRILFVVVPG